MFAPSKMIAPCSSTHRCSYDNGTGLPINLEVTQRLSIKPRHRFSFLYVDLKQYRTNSMCWDRLVSANSTDQDQTASEEAV